jgi:CelD/BcsL family acetyltransferase involved in cellulose biosynthesis
MVQSFDTEHPLAKYSPSEHLLHSVFAMSSVDGVTSFDFGVGENRFKKTWSNDVIKLFYVAHAATRAGQLYGSLMRLRLAAIRYVKRNPRLFSALQEARLLHARLRGRA